MKKLVILILISIFLINSISAITIIPARYNLDFRPGLDTDITFNIDSNLDRELEIYIKGDLAQYMQADKKSVFKKGEFKVHIALPEDIELLGQTRTLIGARELVDEELRVGIAVATAVEASVYIFVPYPGKYVESSLKAHDVNLNEPVNFELDVQSRGNEAITVKPRIEILSEEGELIDTLDFLERDLNKDEKILLKKTLNTAGYNAGTYIAESIVDYNGKQSKSNTTFRIGDLTIDIVNYTEEIEVDGMKPFTIDIQSGWNNQINGAYATVRISNSTKQITSFTTTPTSLEPWEKKTIYGFFNSSEAKAGETYNSFISVFYFGGGVEKTASKTGTIKFIERITEEEIDYYFILSISFGIIIFILIFFWIFDKVISVKHGKKRKY